MLILIDRYRHLCRDFSPKRLQSAFGALCCHSRNTGASLFSFTISVLGSFTCNTQHTGPTASRPIRRTKQLWLSVLLKDTSAATGQAGIQTHILITPELESNALDRSATPRHFDYLQIFEMLYLPFKMSTWQLQPRRPNPLSPPLLNTPTSPSVYTHLAVFLIKVKLMLTNCHSPHRFDHHRGAIPAM